MGKPLFKLEHDPVLSLLLTDSDIVICVEGDDDVSILKEYFKPYCETSRQPLIRFATPQTCCGVSAEDAASALKAGSGERSSGQNGCRGVIQCLKEKGRSSPKLFGLLDGDVLLKSPSDASRFIEASAGIDEMDPDYWRHHEPSSNEPLRAYYIPRHEVENFLVERRVLLSLLRNNTTTKKDWPVKLVERLFGASAEEVQQLKERRVELAELYEVHLSRYCTWLLSWCTLFQTLEQLKSGQLKPSTKASPETLKSVMDACTQLLAEAKSNGREPVDGRVRLLGLLEGMPDDTRSCVMKAWEREENHWRTLCCVEGVLSVELMLKFLDGKRLWESFRARQELGEHRMSDETTLKRTWVKLSKDESPVVGPRVPPVLAKLVDHFLKEAGKPSLSDWIRHQAA